MPRFGTFWTGCESSPASFPTRSTSALAGDVVVLSEVVSAVPVPRNETDVLLLCTGGGPSASVSAGLTRVRSATDFVVSLDVVFWLGAAALFRDHLADCIVLLDSVPYSHCELSMVFFA